MIKQIKLFLSLSLLLMASVINAQEVSTFDFTTPDSNGKIYGITAPQSTTEPAEVNGIPLTNGDCTLTVTNSDPKSRPMIRYSDADKICALSVTNSSELKLVSTRQMVKVVFELYKANTSFILSWDSGSYAKETYTWTGDATTLNMETGNASLVTKIHVTVLSETYTDVSSVAELSALADATRVRLTKDASCIAQSDDKLCIAASCDGDVLYFTGDQPLVTSIKGQIIPAGVTGLSTKVGGVPAILVKDGYEVRSVFDAPEVAIDGISDEYVGKLVAVNNVSIVENSSLGIYQLAYSSSALNVGTKFLSTINATTSSTCADVVGVIENDGTEYVIQPVSIVEKLYSATETIAAPQANVSASNGNIIIGGEWNHSEVYSIDGKLIAADKSEISCGSGIYIVVVDGVTIAKVTLR